MPDIKPDKELEIMRKEVRLDELKLNIKRFTLKKVELEKEMNNVKLSIEQTNKNIEIIRKEIENLKGGK